MLVTLKLMLSAIIISFIKVVVHGGMIREKPSSPEEAHEFIKGFLGLAFMFLLKIDP